MLAKEQQKLSQGNNHSSDNDDDNDNDDDDIEENDNNEEIEASSAPSESEDISEHTSSSSNTVTTTTTVTAETVLPSTTSKKESSTPSTYPVSSTGRCPYCGASDVKYIIVVSVNTKDTELPQSLQQLLKGNQAFKMAKGEVQWARATSWGRVAIITKIIFKQRRDLRLVQCSFIYYLCLVC